MASTLLKFGLTACGMFDIVLPYIFFGGKGQFRILVNSRLQSTLLYARRRRIRTQRSLARLKDSILEKFITPKRYLIDLPYELRERIYYAICMPTKQGHVKGAHHILLINRQIYQEARPIFDDIEHFIIIGDLERYKQGSLDYMGEPRILQVEDCFVWHFSSLRKLVLDVSICSIGSMTPDCFDVYIAHNGKEQWRNLKSLVGIWPETREVPLETVRLVLQQSSYDTSKKLYRADFIRVIRNFKRTRVWAETGDCSLRRGNTSKLLPLVRAFNQGRRNWLKDSTIDNNLLVRYEKQILPERAIEASVGVDVEKIEGERRKWSIVPVNDTSRSDNSTWPEWTGKEEKYIHDKMVPRVRDREYDWECRECLAVFDTRRELRFHRYRGQARC